MQIHIDRGGERYGPYSLEDVNAHLASGALLPTDNAWHDGLTDWVKLTEMEGVRPVGVASAAQSSAPAGSKKGLKVALKVVGGLAAVAGVTCLVMFVLLPWLDKRKAAKATDAPKGKIEWAYLPKDTDLVARFQVGAIYNLPAIQTALQTNAQAKMGIAMLEAMIGLKPSDIETITIGVSGTGKLAQSQLNPGGGSGGAPAGGQGGPGGPSGGPGGFGGPPGGGPGGPGGGPGGFNGPPGGGSALTCLSRKPQS